MECFGQRMRDSHRKTWLDLAGSNGKFATLFRDLWRKALSSSSSIIMCRCAGRVSRDRRILPRENVWKAICEADTNSKPITSSRTSRGDSGCDCRQTSSYSASTSAAISTTGLSNENTDFVVPNARSHFA